MMMLPLVMSWTDQFDTLTAPGQHIRWLPLATRSSHWKHTKITRPCLMLDSYKLVAQVGQMLLNS